MEREPWPKPLIVPALGEDPVMHLARRRPADPTLTQLATVRVHGGERDGDEFLIPLSDVVGVLDRAVRFRAVQWPEVGTPEVVRQDLPTILHASPLIMRMPGGWIEVGKVGDFWAGPDWLRVWWHETTDQVKIERPRGWQRHT